MENIEDDEILVKTLIDQNKIKSCAENFVMKVVYRFKCRYPDTEINVVLEVDHLTRSHILKEGKVNIGWRRCNVSDYVHITRCFKCSGFGHMAKECRNNLTCSFCAGPHKYSECTSDVPRCNNCILANKKSRQKLDIDHESTSKECPSYNRVVCIQQSKINYGDEDV